MQTNAGTAARFAFITDTHYHPDAPWDFGAPKMLTRAPEVLAATVPAVNALQPDFILHGGDLFCGGTAFELPDDLYEQSLRDVAAAYSGFEAPVHYVPGNHDCRASDFSFEDLGRAFPMPGILGIAEVAPRLRVALANVYHTGHGEGGGLWTDELDDALREANRDALSSGSALILVQHPWIAPNFIPEGGNEDAGCIQGAGRLRATLRECPAVVAAFTGHRHINRIRMLGDLLLVDTACLIGYPFGFREVALDSRGWMTCRFHQLDLPELMRESRARSDELANDRWRGEEGDRDTEILLPRLRELWR